MYCAEPTKLGGTLLSPCNNHNKNPPTKKMQLRTLAKRLLITKVYIILPVGTYESSLLVFSKANMSTESVPNFCFLSTAAKGNVPNALVDLLCIPPPCFSMPRATSGLPCAP